MSSRRSERVFGLAMLAGAALALFGLLAELDADPAPLPDDAIARVDDHVIPRADYERAIAALEADLRRPLDARDHREVIDRLVDELLLVERGLALDLVRRDPYLRTALARAMLDRVQAEVALADPPSELELRAHHGAHPERFTATDRIALVGHFFRAREQADRARALALAGEPREVIAALADTPALALPSTPLSPAKLRDYLGPDAAAQALELELGELGEPIAVEGGVWLLECWARTPGRVPAFEDARERVVADLRREREDAALRDLIAQLRAEATITIAEPG